MLTITAAARPRWVMNTGSLDNDTVFRMSLVLCLRSETGIILGAFDISSTSYDDINGTINIPFYQEFVVVCYLKLQLGSDQTVKAVLSVEL